jgi:hypothetical protein
LTVEGELSDDSAAAFEEMTVRRVDGTTVLIGPVRDQPELQGILQRLSDMGLTLLSATAISRATPHGAREVGRKAPRPGFL